MSYWGICLPAYFRNILLRLIIIYCFFIILLFWKENFLAYTQFSTVFATIRFQQIFPIFSVIRIDHLAAQSSVCESSCYNLWLTQKSYGPYIAIYQATH